MSQTPWLLSTASGRSSTGRSDGWSQSRSDALGNLWILSHLIVQGGVDTPSRSSLRHTADARVERDTRDRRNNVAAIYHFTHGKNLDAILAAGELRPSATAENAVDIADAKIKSSRTNRTVSCGPRGCVGDYVPFYFAPRSPMLFRIQQGGVEGVDGDPKGLVYFATTTERLDAAGLVWVFTDGNAAAAVTQFFDDGALLAEKVDWALMRATYWNNTTEDGDRVRRRGAECLVHGAVPLDVIDEIGVYNAAAQTRGTEILMAAGRDLTVAVRGDWYF
jgi:hypothetical protein